MTDNRLEQHSRTERAIQQVLQAEKDAEQAIHDCEQEALQMLHQAQIRAQHISLRTDQRITNLEMRHGHRLDQTIRAIERQGDDQLRLDAGQHFDQDGLQAVVEALAMELCQLRSTPEA